MEGMVSKPIIGLNPNSEAGYLINSEADGMTDEAISVILNTRSQRAGLVCKGQLEGHSQVV